MLNEKQKLFVETYMRNGYQKSKAYQDVYNCKIETAYNGADRLFKNPEIIDYLHQLQKELFESMGITAERVAIELADMAFAKLDENNTNASKAKALELLQKQLGLQKQNIKADVDSKVTIKVGIDDDAEAN